MGHGGGGRLIVKVMAEMMAKGRRLTPAEAEAAVERHMNPPRTEAEKWFDQFAE